LNPEKKKEKIAAREREKQRREMAAVIPKSISSSTVGKDNNSLLDPPKELDAGALFVLKSRG
jgi:hypothetical protein